MSRTVLSSGLLLGLGLVQFSVAQESHSKPDAPTPKITQLVPGLPKKSSATAWEKRAPEAQTVADLPALAASVAAYISVEAGCQPNLRTVLVSNFTLPGGDTSAYGIQLADQLSRELSNNEYKVRVIDRERLQNLLADYRIPARSINHAVVRWIADELGAKFMVFGTTETLDNGVVMLSSQLIHTTFKDWSGYSLIVNLSSSESERNLEPVEPFPPLPGITSSTSGEPIYEAGADGTGLPQCTYMPNPPYSERARKLNLTGPVTAEAVIDSQGKLENVRIVSGLPGDLNEQTITTLKTWRCQPALRGDKTVPTLVPFTVRFRVY